MKKETNTQFSHENINPKVAELDFERLKWKLAHSSDAKMSPEDAELAEREYRRFLTLTIQFPKAVLVPTHLMDEFWHCHILDTVSYKRDCEMLFGRFLNHCPYFGEYGNDDKQMMEDAYNETKILYKSVFGEDVPKLESSPAECLDDDPGECQVGCSNSRKTEALPARCRSKPCHVKPTCRCR